MKFHWFHLMPYPELPADLKQRYRSVWVDLPAREVYDPEVGCRAYNDYLDELEYADQLGFDGICLNEHHSNGYGTMPSPNLMAAALARRTSHAAIVILGNSVVLYNPPIRIAEEMAMIDVLSGGRLVSGFPVGTPMDTAWCMGENPTSSREKYYEGVDLIIRAWKSDKPFAFNGKHTQLRYVNPWPRPMQQPHPPVWIPGGGSYETWGWCVQNDYLYAYLSYFGYKRAKAMMDGYWEAVEAGGRDKNPYRAAFLQFIALAEDEAHAEELYSEAALYFYDRCMHIYGGFANAPGYQSAASVKRGLASQVQQAASGGVFGGPITWKQIVDDGYILVGNPKQVLEQLHDVCDTLHVGHLMTLMQFGNLGKATTTYNTEQFARHVMPHLRGRFSEYEDRWYPKGLGAGAVTAPAMA